MTRWLWIASVLLVSSFAAFSETELPESDDYQSFEVEPPALLPNRMIDSEKAPDVPNRSNRDPVELENQLERAKRAAADAEQLFKRGVLSKAEAELRALRVVRKAVELENARFERAKADYAVQQTRFEMGEISKEALATIERGLETAKRSADAAAANRERAEIEAAEMNLRRQRKLAALGSARAADVSRAEQKVADLKAGKN